MVVYDVGANVGHYTLALSRLVGDSGRVYSFEPGVRWAYFLRRHIELNALRNVTLVQAAVSDSVGLVQFTGWAIDNEGSCVVPSISLDGFMAAGFPPPAFIKMDIEGAEASALQGARDLLSNVKPAWLLATHSEGLRSFCQSLLAQNGYRFTSFDCVSDPGSSPDFVAFAKTHSKS
jgi:FkbM family methyltransferase